MRIPNSDTARAFKHLANRRCARCHRIDRVPRRSDKAANHQSMFEPLTQVHDAVTKPEMFAALSDVFAADPSTIASPPAEIARSNDVVAATYNLMAIRMQEGLLSKDATLRSEWRILVERPSRPSRRTFGSLRRWQPSVEWHLWNETLRKKRSV